MKEKLDKDLRDARCRIEETETIEELSDQIEMLLDDIQEILLQIIIQ
jgi:hypothetical protein